MEDENIASMFEELIPLVASVGLRVEPCKKIHLIEDGEFVRIQADDGRIVNNDLIYKEIGYQIEYGDDDCDIYEYKFLENIGSIFYALVFLKTEEIISHLKEQMVFDLIIETINIYNKEGLKEDRYKFKINNCKGCNLC